MNLIHEREQRGTRGEMGRILITVLGMVAQMERRFIKDRQRDVIQKGKAKGVHRGGKARLNRKAFEELTAQGAKASPIAKTVGCSRMQSHRILKAAL